jgi:hypothetical protein
MVAIGRAPRQAASWPWSATAQPHPSPTTPRPSLVTLGIQLGAKKGAAGEGDSNPRSLFGGG